jgi:hypothetical protein
MFADEEEKGGEIQHLLPPPLKRAIKSSVLDFIQRERSLMEDNA